LTVRRVPLAKLALYACIPLAIIVMVGGTRLHRLTLRS
jgi:hypothetical protein